MDGLIRLDESGHVGYSRPKQPAGVDLPLGAHGLHRMANRRAMLFALRFSCRYLRHADQPSIPESRKMARAKKSRRSKRPDAIRVPVRLSPSSARWLKTFAAHEAVEYGEIVERALRLLRRETGFEVTRRSSGESRLAILEATEGESSAVA
jgi:hypothetical protein